MSADDRTPNLPAWATPAIVGILEMALARQITGDSGVVDVTPPGATTSVYQVDAGALVDAVVAALVDEDLVVVPDQHVEVERYVDDAGEHRWRALDEQNGQTIATSGEGYVSTTHCAHMAARIFPTTNTKEHPST